MAAGVEFLISQGHPPAVVFHYSLRQFRSFCSLAWDRVGNQHHAVVMGSRLAYHADGKEFTEYVSELSGE